MNEWRRDAALEIVAEFLTEGKCSVFVRDRDDGRYEIALRKEIGPMDLPGIATVSMPQADVSLDAELEAIGDLCR